MNPTKGKAPTLAGDEALNVNNPNQKGINMGDFTATPQNTATEGFAGTITATPALVPVFTGTLQGQSVQLCDARTLHAFMVVLRDFSNWIKGRIRKFGFVNGVDFITISRSPELASGNRGASIDYHLTLDMAKELSMVENNEKGREARRYFMACEKQVLAALTTHPTDRIPYAVLPGQTLSAEQADTLRNILTDASQSMPKDLQGLVMREGWSKLKSHFKCSYREIPQSQFAEAVSLLWRHIVQWNESKAPALPAPEPKPEPVTTANLVGLLMGDCMSQRAVLEIAVASTMTLFKAASNCPNGFGEQVAKRVNRDLPLGDLHAIVVAASMELFSRVVVEKAHQTA